MMVWEPELNMMRPVLGAQKWLLVLMIKGLIYWIFPFAELFCVLFIFLGEINVVVMESFARLFSCGTSKDGQAFLIEWDESEGSIERIYQGLCKCSLSVLQFDTTKNQFLAAGDNHMIKFWDMDNVELLITIDADGGLPVSSSVVS